MAAVVAPAPKPRRKSSQRRKEEHFWIIPEVVDEIKVNRETGVAQVYRQWRQGRYLGKVCVSTRTAAAAAAALLHIRSSSSPPPSSSSSFARALRSSGWFCQVLCFYGGHEQQRAGGKGRAPRPS